MAIRFVNYGESYNMKNSPGRKEKRREQKTQRRGIFTKKYVQRGTANRASTK